MDHSTLLKCEQLIQNREVAKSVFFWDSALIQLACAGIGASRSQNIDEEVLLTCKNLLKEKVSAFSNFRSTARSPIAAMMAVSQNPERMLDEGLVVYELLKQEFWNSAYLPVTAIIITQLAENSQFETIASRTKDIYEAMKQNHPFLTSGEDSAFCAMMALSSKTNEELIADIEICYHTLKTEFFSSNAVYSLCQVLALCDGTPEEKCRMTMELFHKLKEEGHKYGTGYELATLGALAMGGGNQDEIVRDMIEIDEWLSEQKGFGAWSSVTKKQRLMYAGILSQQEYRNQDAMQAASVGGVISMVIAQNTAMCAAIAASMAAVSSASSSSN